ncbi:cytochrome P450 [Amylostereum chailletii]|nr:cytochrome P450 [Amylostereum chailletii]
MAFDTLTALGVAFLGALVFWTRTRKPFPLPPGPKPWPIVGNVTDVPQAKQLWLRATEFAEQYGDIVYLHILGQGIVFLNTAETANELMEKRGAIYSDRVPLVMSGELCGAGDMVAFTRYGDVFRRQRRLMSRGLAQNKIKTYLPLITTSTRSFLQSLLDSPSDYLGSIRQYAGGLNLLVVYGLHVKDKDDPYLVKVENATKLLSVDFADGGGLWAVDFFPWLKHLPAWFPGAGFKTKAAAWKKMIVESVDLPFDAVKAMLQSEKYTPSFCSSMLEEAIAEGKDLEDEEYALRWAANSMYAASMDTTITVMQHFLLAMMQNPTILHRAQAELDFVLGEGPARMPTFEDRDKLPYIEAIWEESLRWACPVPMGLPHRLMEDDIYRGMLIPKGTIILGNIWAMLRDPVLYPDPDRFNPDRFLENVDPELARRRDPRSVVFGYGRRRCPGSHLVESSIWLLMATMLSVLSIRAPLGPDGKPVEPKVVFDNLVFRCMNPIDVVIEPRSEQAKRFIAAANFET